MSERFNTPKISNPLVEANTHLTTAARNAEPQQVPDPTKYFFDFLRVTRIEPRLRTQTDIDTYQPNSDEDLALLLEHTVMVHIQQLPKFLTRTYDLWPTQRVLFMQWFFSGIYDYAQFYSVLKAVTHSDYSGVDRQFSGESMMNDCFSAFQNTTEDALFMVVLPKIDSVKSYERFVDSVYLKGEIDALFSMLQKKKADPTLRVPKLLLIYGVDTESDVPNRILDAVDELRKLFN